MTLAKLRSRLIFSGAVVTGILVDFLLFSVVVLVGGGLEGWLFGLGFSSVAWAWGSLMFAQGVGAGGGMLHDFFIIRGWGEVKKVSGGRWGVLITVLLVAVVSGPFVLLLGYLTNNLWMAKLTATAVLHFFFCLFLIKHSSSKQ